MIRQLIWVGMSGSVLGCAKPIEAVSGLSDVGIDSGLPDQADDVDPPEGEPDPDEPTDPVDPGIEMSREAMVGHLEALMAIAETNDGNRAAGTGGYGESIAYVTEQLEDAGYTVTEHSFDIEQEVWNEDPAVEAGRPLAFGDEFYPFGYTGSGTVSAPVQAVDVQIPPPDGDNTTTSGCQSEDFDGFVPGRIALMQRGSCTFQIKVDYAVEAGAIGALIFNEGQPGRREAFAGTLDAEAETPIPVFALSYDAGVELAELDTSVEVSIVADRSVLRVPTANLMAETAGDPDRAVVVGAHLDSVVAGPGINDNGSGVAMVLEMALRVAESDWSPNNQVRFAFWGGEELGLLGSMDYVLNMSDEDHGRIMANLNFDMVASPNPVRMVYDGSGSLGGEGGPTGSSRIESVFADWFDSQGLAYEQTPFDGRSDYGPFIWTGIPAGGLFTGAEAIMSASEASDFGGTAGEAYDACYHQGCDTIENLDLDVLDELAAAAAHSVVQLGDWEGPLTDGPGGPPVSLAEQSRLQLDWVPTSCGHGPKVWRR